MRAVWVNVRWSESGSFEDNELIPFKEFESRCREIARKTGSDNGYMKTKCNVLFDDGSQYEVRLDLAENDDHGFEHRAKSTVAYYRTRDKGTMASYVEFLEKIEWEVAA